MGEAKEGACAVYDVFLNHRGDDTKKNVASLIYHGLIKYGLRVFLDRDELQGGDSICDKIESAIESSSVHVAIFSKSYAGSHWCLNELLEMLKSRSSGRCKIIPVFYDVKPEDLRRIKDGGPYAKAFLKHQERGVEGDLVQRWKDALKDAAGISGTVFNTEEDDYGVLVEETVAKVLNEAKWELLRVAEYPVGLHQAEKDFNKFLKGQLSGTTLKERQLSGTTVVGIMGLDGSGKSTLVKNLHNFYLISRKFNRYCYLSELNKKDLVVQELVRCFGGDDKYINSDTTNERLQTSLRRCGPVLIVLDGLDNEEQIESLLLVVKKVVAEGSLILVTCHDKYLLKGRVNLLYDVKLLQGKDAHDLLCWYAFGSPKPPKALEKLVEKFLKICGGFPLALKVLGRKLFEEDRRYWEEQLKDLSRPELPGDIVDKILKVSYNSLTQKGKEVFLDVAHFLVGEDTDLAVKVLEGLHDISGLLCLKDLQHKCLLDLEEIEHCKRPFAKGSGIQWRTKGSSKIRMHDLVRKMATQTASEDSCSSSSITPLRLCQLDDTSIFSQLQFRGRYNVRGIRCEHTDEHERQVQDRKMPEMADEIYGLRLLVLHHFRVPFRCNRLSGDLIWLRMHKSIWGKTIPSTLSLRNLRVLELDGVELEALDRMDGDNFPSRLTEIRERNIPSSSRVDENSKEASSSASGSFWDWFRFKELPDFVKLVLKNVRGLKSLPIDFKALRNLRHLDLSGWTNLEKMPDSFTGLSQLQYLALQDCWSLFISDLGEITKLEYLDFEGCLLLRKLPAKTTAQRELRYLNLMRTGIEELPEDMGELEKLEQLLITSSYLRALPDSFHKLGQLRILSLFDCCHLKNISSSISIEHFPCLESLQLWDVDVVPQGIAWSSVKILHVKAPLVSKFSFEREQGKMPQDRSHSQRSTDDGTSSVGATDYNSVSPLTELRLETGISKLWIPPGEICFPYLEIVDLSGSRRLTEVASLPCNLRSLYLKNCPLLTTLPCLSNLACIRILDISGCHKLEALYLEGVRSIEEIAAKDCCKLQSIQGLADLACIRILDISGCQNLKALNLEGLRSIEEIKALECWNLQSIQGLAQLRTLSYLDVSTFHEDPNSTIWSEILRFPSTVSTAILGGANVLRMNAEEMDSVKQSILKEFQGVTITDIPIMENMYRVPLIKMTKSYGAFLLCFIAKKNFQRFRVYFPGDKVYYTFDNPSFVRGAKFDKGHWLYTFMCSNNSKLFEEQCCSIQGLIFKESLYQFAPLEYSFTEAWIMMIRNETDGVKICKLLLNSLCRIPEQAVQ